MLAQYFLLFFTIADFAYTQDVSEELLPEVVKLVDKEKKLSDNILAILDHYKQQDPVGLPGLDIPDPYLIPDINVPVSFSSTSMNIVNTSLYGISKFRVVYVNTEISTMQVQAVLTIDKLQARGNYTLATWWSSGAGPFTSDVTGLEIKVRADLGVEYDGKLKAQDINIDLALQTINMSFKNLGFFGGVLQSFINSVGPILFDSFKPYILKEVYTKAKTTINNILDELAGDIQFPNSISPLDMVNVKLRNKVRKMELDPYKIRNYNTTVSFFGVKLNETQITGISSFQRVGNITLKMENNTAIADFGIGTQNVEGRTHWEISTVNDLISRGGNASFSVEYITVRLILGQSLDVRMKPEFRSLDFEIGNIHVRSNGAGTLDYVIELVVNILPTLLRYQIMDTIEGLLKQKIQQELNEIEIEEIIKEKLKQMDEIQKNAFKLWGVMVTDMKDNVYDQDEFFNF